MSEQGAASRLTSRVVKPARSKGSSACLSPRSEKVMTQAESERGRKTTDSTIFCKKGRALAGRVGTTTGVQEWTTMRKKRFKSQVYEHGATCLCPASINNAIHTTALCEARTRYGTH